MTKRELLARIEALEARVAELQARPIYYPPPLSWVAPPPACDPKITVTCADTTSAFAIVSAIRREFAIADRRNA